MSTKRAHIAQRLWGWPVAAYLFLLSAGAGAYVTVFILNVILPDGPVSPFLPAAKAGLIAAAAFAILAVVFFITNLKSKANAFRIFIRPFSSWLAAGSYVTLLFIILDLILIGIWAKPPVGLNNAPGIITLVLALFMLVYSGMLLKVLKPFSFWNSWLLPLLCALSGITAGAMFVVLIAAIYGLTGAVNMSRPLLAVIYYLNFFLLAYLVVLVLFIWQSARNPLSGSSAQMLVKGRTGYAFWTMVVLFGLVLPLVAGFYLVSSAQVGLGLLITLSIIAALCAMTGSYVLRYLILALGIPKTITVSGQRVDLHETAFIPVSQRVKYRCD